MASPYVDIGEKTTMGKLRKMLSSEMKNNRVLAKVSEGKKFAVTSKRANWLNELLNLPYFSRKNNEKTVLEVRQQIRKDYKRVVGNINYYERFEEIQLDQFRFSKKILWFWEGLLQEAPGGSREEQQIRMLVNFLRKLLVEVPAKLSETDYKLDELYTEELLLSNLLEFIQNPKVFLSEPK